MTVTASARSLAACSASEPGTNLPVAATTLHHGSGSVDEANRCPTSRAWRGWPAVAAMSP